MKSTTWGQAREGWTMKGTGKHGTGGSVAGDGGAVGLAAAGVGAERAHRRAGHHRGDESLAVGQTLSADISGILDADGLSNPRFTYQWLADDADISGATGSTYDLTAAEQGKVIKVGWISGRRRHSGNADGAAAAQDCSQGGRSPLWVYRTWTHSI